LIDLCCVNPKPHARPPSLPIATIAPRCLLGWTFTDFDPAQKRKEKFGYCGTDLVYRRWTSWSPWRDFCGRWGVF